MNATPKKIEINVADIEHKQNRLDSIKAELKTEFVGIDYIIDELVDYIRIWYLMPEVLTRPIIVCLWGMTGVGKTDLIRKLVSKLEFQDRFAEVELNNSDSTGYYSWKRSVGEILESQSLTDGKPSIVLFDEIQRFNTIDQDGTPLPNVSFQDFWELLSDGKLAKREVKAEINSFIDEFLMNAYHKKKQKEREAAEGAMDKGGENGDFMRMPRPPLGMGMGGEEDGIGTWQARNLKKLFELDESVLALAQMKEEDLLVAMQERKKKKKIYEAVEFSKALIIISGNLDDAFSMATETSEADVDADIFHAYTEKITLVNVKNALSKKFKPEQVARFGNIHLIYRSLQRKDFEQLIRMEIAKLIERNYQVFGVQLTISQHLNTLIYQNGVFPVQGVRPVFSCMTDILESNLAKVLFEALIHREDQVAMDYDFEGKKILAVFGHGRLLEIPYIGRVDKIRQSNLADVVADVSVHECGHAVVYGVLFGLAPLQLKSKVASTYVGGFTFPHQIHQSKETLIYQMKVYLAGGLAEDVVFGESFATIGRNNDRWEATLLAMEYIRKYGFSEDFQAYYSTTPGASMDVTVTDKGIEAMIKKLAIETKEMLIEHKDLLLAFSRALNVHGDLQADQVSKIAKEHGLDFVVKEESHLFIANYAELLESGGTS